jgi:hypothetical protein
MSLADELMKLRQLRESGALSEAEFRVAKDRLLHAPAPAGNASQEVTDEADARTAWERGDEDNSLGRAANRYVSYQAVFGVIALLIFLVILFAVFIPMAIHMGDQQSPIP